MLYRDFVCVFYHSGFFEDGFLEGVFGKVVIGLQVVIYLMKQTH